MNPDYYKHNLITANPIRKSILCEAIETLQLPPGSKGLDAGCGIGIQCLQLAETIGFNGHIIGVDVSSEFLNHGRSLVKEANLSNRISFQEADIADLPFATNTFDWAWSADCVGYGPWEPLPLLKEMTRVVKPGGIIAIAAWSSENLLPGHPALEARLRSTSAGLAPFTPGGNPETHFQRALNWFHKLGLKKPRAKVFSESFYSPLSVEIRNALISIFDMRWPDVEKELSSADQKEFRRLCLSDSPEFILNLPDYYAFLTYTLFWGIAVN